MLKLTWCGYVMGCGRREKTELFMSDSCQQRIESLLCARRKKVGSESLCILSLLAQRFLSIPLSANHLDLKPFSVQSKTRH